VLLLLTLQTSSSLKDKDMPNYNTQGITSSAGSDPRNLGGSEGYGNPTASTSSGIMSSTANPTANDDDNNDEPSFFESIANLFSDAGADLPSGGSSDDDGDSGISFYDSPMFTPYDGGSDDDTTPQGGLPFETTAADRALYEALGVEVPEVYQGTMGEEEPEPNLDTDVLQDALQPEPIIVEELEVKAGDTLSGIAKDKGVSLQSVIDANPQIKNPDMIRPGEVVSVPDPRFEGVPKPRGVADSPRLSEGVADPRKIGDAESTDAPVVAEETEADTGTDPRELGGAEGYGSVGAPADTETGEGLMSPRFDTKGGEVAGATTKAYDFLTKSGLNPPEGQLLSDRLAVTGDQFTNREDALEYIDDSLDFEPTRKAAFSATVDAESSSGLLEGSNYTKQAAIATLGGGDANRIARIEALYGRSNRLSAEDQVTLFDIAYGDRMGNAANEGHKYRGRGLIQITGKDNYRKYGEAIGVGDALVNDPDILLNNPSVMLAVTEAYLQDRLPERNDGLSANDLKDAIGHSGEVPRGVTWNGTGSAYKGNQRWMDVIARLEEAGKQDEADEARLNNEFTAQEKVGTYIDGDIGSGSLRAMRSWLTQRGVDIPEGTNARELVRLVNETD